MKALCWMFGAGRVVAIDRVPERMAMARSHGKAETINFDEEDVYERLMEMTGGRGPDRCIDAVGAEAHSTGSIDAVYDKVKTSLYMTTDRAHALRQAIYCCRKGGTLSIPGVYLGFPDKLPFGALMNKGITVKTGQTHVQRYLKPLLEKIESGQTDPSFVVTHRVPLAEGPCSATSKMGASKWCSDRNRSHASLSLREAGNSPLAVSRSQQTPPTQPRLQPFPALSNRNFRSVSIVRLVQILRAVSRGAV
jgi:threonine dehydrogenase-like Zn-dependent dehydrogenase